MSANNSEIINRSRKKHKKISKKTLIIIFVAVAVIFSAISLIVHFATKVTNESYKNCAIGDVDGSGTIDSNDALLILNYISGEAELFDNQVKLADINLDGVVDSKDAYGIFRYAVGEIDSLPYLAQGTDTDIQSGTLSAEISTDEIKISARIINIWKNDDGTFSYQLNISEKNLTDSYLDGKDIKLSFSGDIAVSKSWDCECEADGKTLSVSVGSIEEKSTATCGIILTGSADLVINNLETE